jgi:hypothetical protein
MTQHSTVTLGDYSHRRLKSSRPAQIRVLRKTLFTARRVESNMIEIAMRRVNQGTD